jgi:hypothetical protein
MIYLGPSESAQGWHELTVALIPVDGFRLADLRQRSGYRQGDLIPLYFSATVLVACLLPLSYHYKFLSAAYSLSRFVLF